MFCSSAMKIVAVLMFSIFSLPVVAGEALKSSSLDSLNEIAISLAQRKEVSNYYSYFEFHGMKVKTFRDGAKGYELDFPPPGSGDYSIGNSSVNSEENRRSAIKNMLCANDIVAIVQPTSAISFIGDSGKMIYTKYGLQVKRPIFENEVTSSLGGVLDLVVLGGEVASEGTIFRITHSLQRPFHAGKTYLLTASRPRPDFPYVSNTQTIEIIEGKIYPLTGSWLNYSAGTNLSTIEDNLLEMRNSLLDECR